MSDRTLVWEGDMTLQCTIRTPWVDGDSVGERLAFKIDEIRRIIGEIEGVTAVDIYNRMPGATGLEP